MAKCDFSVNFTGTATQATTKAKAAIEKNGGSFKGDDTRGEFSVPTPAGKVAGTYSISGQTFTVAITDKPFLVPCGAIESQVRSFVSQS